MEYLITLKDKPSFVVPESALRHIKRIHADDFISAKEVKGEKEEKGSKNKTN